MTDAELDAIEARAKALDYQRTEPEEHVDLAPLLDDVPALVAEVRRLRALLAHCEWIDTTDGVARCPFCGADRVLAGQRHADDCAAFPVTPLPRS